MMDKANKLFLDTTFGTRYPSSACGKACSDLDGHFLDKRVARLLVLLKQLDESAAGLAALPKRELSEVLLSAIRVCGFVDPAEARDVTAAVLEVIEARGSIPEGP